MARGFLSGALVGGAASILVAGVTSVLAPQPNPPVINDTAPGAASAPAPLSSDATRTENPGDSDVVTGARVPQAQAPSPDTLTELDETDTQTTAQPSTTEIAVLETPADASGEGGLSSQGDPSQPRVTVTAPQAPQQDADIIVSTDPAKPPLPDAQAPQGQFEDPARPATDATVEEAVIAPDLDTDTVDAAPISPAAPASPAAPDTAQAAPEAPDTPTAEAAPEENTAEEEQEFAVLRPASRPSIGTPATTLTGNGSLIRTTQDDSSDTAEAAGIRPITAYAQAFDNADDKPLMSIVLIDDGSSPTSGAAGIAALNTFPYPLSFAIDATLPDAAERMALYRAEGFEVLALVDLPQGATPADAETVIAASVAQVPEAVAILEGPGAGLQAARDVSDQVTAILSQSGHGLVTQDKGLNTVPKLARKEGVPAAPIFRDFDSKGQTAVVIRRFLDQAAFRAGQEGAVIMLGRSRPDTISALLLWGLQDRAGTVALSPISAVLTREDG